jgi:phospholipid N-methyltransferase
VGRAPRIFGPSGPRASPLGVAPEALVVRSCTPGDGYGTRSDGSRKGCMNQQLADRLRFLRAFAANPRQVGAILPTSRLAVRDMLDLGDVPGARLVVELGAGTGSQTAEILARMAPDARLVALEIDPRLARLLEERFDDPRLEVVCDSAENLAKHLDGEQADVLVCALPFTSLEPGLRRRILESLPSALRPGGVALVIQYSPLIQNELRRLFGSVRRRISPLNVPPAFLFACSLQPHAAEGQAG